MKTKQPFPGRARTLLACMFAGSVSFAVHAAQSGAGDSAASAAANASASSTTAAAGGHSSQQTAQLRDVRLSQLIGKDVRDAQGQALGSVEDLIVDSTDNRVHYAIVSLDQAQRPSSRLLALPLSVLGIDSDASSQTTATGSAGAAASAASGSAKRAAWNERNELVLNIPMERLERAPSFERDRWPDFGRADQASLFERYWGDWSSDGIGVQAAAGGGQATAGTQAATGTQATTGQRATEGSSTSASAGTTASSGASATAQPVSAESLKKAWRATELLKAKVVSAQGQPIGEVEDAVVDARTGELRYGVVAFDHPEWAQRDKLVQVPGHQLIPKSHDQVIANLTKDQLAQAPSFDRSKWPNLNEPGYRQQVDRYLSSRDGSGSSTAAGSTGTAGGSTGTASGSTGAQGAPSGSSSDSRSR